MYQVLVGHTIIVYDTSLSTWDFATLVQLTVTSRTSRTHHHNINDFWVVFTPFLSSSHLNDGGVIKPPLQSTNFTLLYYCLLSLITKKRDNENVSPSPFSSSFSRKTLPLENYSADDTTVCIYLVLFRPKSIVFNWFQCP